MSEVTQSDRAQVDLRALPLHALARMCQRDWPRAYFGARPYIDALLGLTSLDEPYGCETARDVVVGLLANAQTWKGPIARAVKAELTRRLKGKRS